MLQLRFFSFVVRADYVSNWRCRRVSIPLRRCEKAAS